MRQRDVNVRLVALVCLSLCAATLWAQSPLKSTADTDFFRSNYKDAAKKYKDYLRTNPGDPESTYRLAYSLHVTKDYLESIEAYKDAIRLKYLPHISYYNMACAYALAGDSENALESLERAANAGYVATTQYQNDPDLVSVRDSARYKRVFQQTTDPTSQSENIAVIKGLNGLWDTTAPESGGSMSWLASSKGFAQIMDVVLAKGRLVYLQLSFQGPGKPWRATGVDSSGASYSGDAALNAKGISLIGSRDGMETRLDVVLVGRVEATVSLLDNRAGKWTVKETYVFRRRPN